MSFFFNSDRSSLPCRLLSFSSLFRSHLKKWRKCLIAVSPDYVCIFYSEKTLDDLYEPDSKLSSFLWFVFRSQYLVVQNVCYIWWLEKTLFILGETNIGKSEAQCWGGAICKSCNFGRQVMPLALMADYPESPYRLRQLALKSHHLSLQKLDIKTHEPDVRSIWVWLKGWNFQQH